MPSPGNESATARVYFGLRLCATDNMKSTREHIIRGYFIRTLITSHFRRILKIMLPPAEI